MKKFQKFGMMTIVVVFLSVVMNSSNCPPPADPPQPCPSFDDSAYESSVFFPHASSCNHFWHCSNGVAYCVACPAGLHWNQEFETCDWPHNAGCCTNPSEVDCSRQRIKECRPVDCNGTWYGFAGVDGCINIFGIKICGYSASAFVSYTYSGRKENCTGGVQWYDCRACQTDCVK